MSCEMNCHKGWLIDPDKDYQLPCPVCNFELDQATLLEAEFQKSWDKFVAEHGVTVVAVRNARYFYFAGAVDGGELIKSMAEEKL